jgi:hypothetical protein
MRDAGSKERIALYLAQISWTATPSNHHSRESYQPAHRQDANNPNVSAPLETCSHVHSRVINSTAPSVDAFELEVRDPLGKLGGGIHYNPKDRAYLVERMAWEQQH